MQIRIPVTKSVEVGDSLRVFGWGSVAVDDDGSLVIDHHRDIIEPAELEKAVYEFTTEARKLDVMHDRSPIGDLIESVYVSPEKLAAMGVEGSARCGWWAGFEVRDPETIARVKSGELAELSVDITATRYEFGSDQAEQAIAAKRADPNDPTRPIGRLRDLKIKLLSLVDRGAGKGVKVALWKRKESTMITIEQIMAKLSPEEQAALADMLKPKAEPEAEAPVEATAAEKALKSQLDAQREELTKLRAERDLEVAISKARADGLEYLAGATIEEIAKARIEVRKSAPSIADKLDAVLVHAAKAIKTGEALKTRGTPRSNGGAATFNDLYEAEKARRPKDDPTVIARELAKQHPDLYRDRGAV